ncbi:MAG: phosphoribosylanthranilate isomerase [Asticcacaulis sp.]|nr:phosphoribosylanthranilate isomerase [Asticcacaulis sp.]
MTIRAKICGLTTLEAAHVAAADSADFLGFIHFVKSPRHLGLDAMAGLMRAIRDDGIDLPLVSVVVNPDDRLLDALARQVKPDLIQLHGHESPERVAEIRARYRPVIKAISVETAEDIAAAAVYESAADHLLFDAKTPKDALPGGMGLSFDWPLMRNWTGAKPWLLAGGLTPGNVAEALRLTGAPMVDVSSGVENAPGVKDSRLISDFLKAVKSL